MHMSELRQRKNTRKVTDPVTHLPLVVHDHADEELDEIPSHLSKEQDELSPEHHEEHQEAESTERHVSLEGILEKELQRARWCSPGDSEVESKTKIQTAIIATLVTAAGAPAGLVALWVWSKFLGRPGFGVLELFAGVSGSLVLAFMVGACSLFLPFPALVRFFRKEIQSRLKLNIDIGVEHSTHEDIIESPNTDSFPSTQVDTLQSLRPPFQSPHQSPETAIWLNSLFHSLWPIINPALFTSISDMLEDALQASLPSFVHGVHVANIGQGSEPMRILGIRWLDAGHLQGDHFNIEIALAYRARTVQRNKGKRLRDRAENAHLLMEFFIPGGVAIPVWVELTGLLATARMRIQLMPNPPFFASCMLTFLGQPKTTIACTPLAKNFLNVMNIPFVSDWLQNTIDGVVSEYVAPRSLTLDLKTMLMGEEKKDTNAEGVLVVTVRSAKDFTGGDHVNIFATKDGKKGDPYVKVGWSKWGKTLWSTRIIKSDGHPVWEETAVLLVGPSETNANELLKFQLMDSDLFTTDDVLGTVEYPLKDIIVHSSNRFSAREDQFTGTNGKPCRGTLSWECGYFPKTTLKQHLAERYDDIKGLVQHIEEETEKELQETKTRYPTTKENKHQKKQDSNEKTQYIIATSPPKEAWPSGIISIGIEKIDGLEIQKVGESGVREGGEDDEAGDLPSPYCTVIINHQKVYKTRTKMKSNNPFYNASTEKFIRDWRSALIIISVRDSRIHESDPLLGVVVLHPQTLFTYRETSHITDSFSLVGGMGYGRIRLSLTFRSVQLQLPRRLLGWEVGRLEIEPHVRGSLDLPPDLAACRLVFRTKNGKRKMDAHVDGGWRPREDNVRSVRLAVSRRYASCLVIEFRKHKHKAIMGLMSDRTLAFAVLWLKDVPDDEDIEETLVVRKNEPGALARARANCTEDVGEEVGQITIKLKFRRGLSDCHQEMAGRDAHIKEVTEVLRCAEESGEVEKDVLFDDDHEEVHSSGEESFDGSLRRTDTTFSSSSEMKGGHKKNQSLLARMGTKISETFEHQEHDWGFEKEV